MASGITLPNVPTFQSNAYVDPSIAALYSKGQGLTGNNITDLPSILRDTVSTSPEASRLYMEGLKASLAPSLRQSQQDIISQLEANNQLTGSTTASSLGNLYSDYLSDLTTSASNFGIADINRAMANRVSLYGTGLNTIQAAGRLGLEDQSQENSFNLENYQNEVAKVLASQKPKTGGLAGALTGGLGGAMAGFMVGGPAGAIIGGLGGAAAGGFGPAGTGGGVMQAGASMAGSKYMSGLQGSTGGAGGGSTFGNNERIDDILKGDPYFGSGGNSTNMAGGKPVGW